MSLRTIDNPCCVQLAIATKNNTTFPSTFEEGCPFGSCGSEFLDNMQGVSVLSRASIWLPRSKRAELAIENPVAFVLEYKAPLNNTLDILLGVSIEDKGYYSKINSS
jgi:hypothetical protein